MSYEVMFESGSLKGRRWRIPDGGTLSIGRSHSCDIRPTEPDVSGKHCALHEEHGRIWLEVLSSHKTALDGVRLPVGKKVEVGEVSRVALGGSLVLRLCGAVADDETGEVEPDETGTLGTGTLATAATRAMQDDTATLGAETATLSGASRRSSTRGSRDETATIGGETSLLTGTLATAATRAAPTGTVAFGGETGTLATAATRAAPTDMVAFGGETGTLATAATRAAPTDTVAFGGDTGTLATVATRAAPTGDFRAGADKAVASDLREESETAMFNGETVVGRDGSETTDISGDDGETQMLHTQMASREELEKLKAAYQQRQKGRIAKRFFLLGSTAAAAVAASIWFSTRTPERTLSLPTDYGSVTILPDLAPSGARNHVVGLVGMVYPSAGASMSRKSENSIEIRARIGKKLDVEIVLAVDVFEDEGAIGESREATFMRYISKSEELVKILDNMYPLTGDDFFGGMEGRFRGVPCSRVEYWRMRGRDNVYGVVSFFRSGTLCCAMRREVPAAEKERAAWMLVETQGWLYADGGGQFAAAQWEGAEDAGCEDPVLELSRCESRFAIDSTAEWSEIERGIRDIMVETWGGDEYADVRSRALKLLVDLRARKATNWKRLVASRVPITLPDGGTTDKMRASELDEAVRKDYPSPDEEWHFLARRRKWWN